MHPGTRLGSYEVVSALGAGGMGEVYRARDTKLDRDVALKILPESFASDPDRLMRFEREAKTLATLNHPNIASIHGLEESEGTRALVMELVEGRDLSELIGGLGEQAALRTTAALPTMAALRTTPGMSLDEVVPIARQIAEALEAAHEAGIIHRDLKPANIKVKADGTVKVLDFGLAKALDPHVARPDVPGRDDRRAGTSARPTYDDAPTVTSPALTQMGVVLGTAAYMSPEQAKGRPVDRRADIWAFGVVLYEMLTGRQLFAVETVSESIAAVLRADVNFAALPTATPSAVRRLLERCLDRDPKTRLRDIGEARVVFAQPLDKPEAVPSRRARPVWPLLLVVATLVAATAAIALQLAGAGERDVEITAFAEPDVVQAAISPDGRSVAFRKADGGAWLRRFDSETSTLLNAETGADVFWSPSGDAVAYSIEDDIWRHPVDGGAPTIVGERLNQVSHGWTWTDDGLIVTAYPTFAELRAVPVGGGPDVVMLTSPRILEGDVSAITPWALPGGRGFLFAGVGDQESGRVEWTDGQERRVVFDEPGAAVDYPVYSPTGHIVYRRRGERAGVWARPFSVSTLEVGAAVQVSLHAGQPSVSTTGVLMIGPATEPWIDEAPRPSRLRRDGTLEAIGAPVRRAGGLSLWSRGERLSVVSRGRRDVLEVLDLKNGGRLQVAVSQGSIGRPFWGLEGRVVGFTTSDGGESGEQQRRLEFVEADGGGATGVVVANAASGSFVPAGIGATGDVVFLRDNVIWTARRDGSSAKRFPSSYAGTIVGFSTPIVSSQAWIAYAGDEVFIERFPVGGGRVSAGAGVPVQWAPDGRSLYVATTGSDTASIAQVPFDPATGRVDVRRAAVLWTIPRLTYGRGVDVSPEGDLILLADPEYTPTQLRTLIIRNWTKLLEQNQ